MFYRCHQMTEKKFLLFLILLPGIASCANDAFRGEARVHHVRCSADGAALCGEALKQTPSASQTRRIANLFRRKNGNRARASNEDITSKPGGGGAKTRYEVRSVERKMQRRKRSAKQLRPSGGTSFEQISQSSTKNIVASNLGPGQPDTKAYLSGHFKDNKKMSAHDQYLSETILSALKLILDKRNSFQNDSKALQLASVLLPKTVAEAHTKKARNQHNPESSTQSRRLPRQGMKFLIDLLSGANATNTTWNARKSNIVPNLVDPTQLGISILKLLFGHEAPLVTRPKYHTLFKKMSAASEAQHVRSDSKNSGQYHLPRAGTNFESLEARLGGQGMLSSANNVPTSSTLTTGDEMKVKGRQVLATNQRVMHGPTKSYIDVTGRRKSWVLLKIPKEDSDMETKGHKEADGDLAVTGKMRAPTTTVQVPGGAPAPAEGQKLKEAEEDISSPQHDDVDGDSISSKGEDMKTDMQHDQSSKITAKLIKTVKKFLGALQSSIEALQSNHQASREPQLEPKSSRPTAGVQLRYAKPTTARLAPANAASRALAREHDPLKEVPTQDEPITVPSPAAVGNRLALGDNVLFQSDAVIGTTRDTTDLAKLKEDLEAFAEKGLEAHNHFRSAHHAPSLRWSDDLANQAEKLAYAMAMKGTITHSDAVKPLGEGENVAKISRVPFEEAGSTAAKLWYSEKGNYSYSYPKLDEKNDAFTQMVWKSTEELGMGCARDLQTNDMYVVALYRPAGNDKRLLRANVLKEGEVGRDVYATIFKKDKTQKPSD